MPTRCSESSRVALRCAKLACRSALHLRGGPEIAQLRVERALESRAGRAPLDISGERRLDHELGKDAQHGGHHQVARREALTVEIGLVAQRLGQTAQAMAREFHCA